MASAQGVRRVVCRLRVVTAAAAQVVEVLEEHPRGQRSDTQEAAPTHGHFRAPQRHQRLSLEMAAQQAPLAAETAATRTARTTDAAWVRAPVAAVRTAQARAATVETVAEAPVVAVEEGERRPAGRVEAAATDSSASSRCRSHEQIRDDPSGFDCSRRMRLGWRDSVDSSSRDRHRPRAASRRGLRTWMDLRHERESAIHATASGRVIGSKRGQEDG